jgi:hypothetical protein
MEARPEFTVIAGPNRAGKSRLSPCYIHCKSFDGDLLALNLRKEHPVNGYPPEYASNPRLYRCTDPPASYLLPILKTESTYL